MVREICLSVSVPFIEQLKNQTVRVSESGTIVLPLIGVVSVDGMTEDDLRSELIHRARKYMYHPQVQVFLKHADIGRSPFWAPLNSPAGTCCRVRATR